MVDAQTILRMIECIENSAVALREARDNFVPNNKKHHAVVLMDEALNQIQIVMQGD